MTNVPCTKFHVSTIPDIAVRCTSENKNATLSTMESLPDSILLEVFQKLTFEAVCVAGRVCKRWYRVSRDPSLRRTVDVTAVPLAAKKIQSLLRHHLDSHVQRLYLHGFVRLLHSRSSRWKTRSLTSNTLALLGKLCPTLSVLRVSDAFLADSTVTTRLNVLDFPSTLSQLSLRGCFFHPSEFFYPEPSGALPVLAVLDLARCIFVSSHDLLCFTRWTSLRVLGLEACHRVNDGGIHNLEPILPYLQVIDVEGTDVGDLGATVLLKQCVQLRSLFLGHTGVTGAAFMNFGRESGGRECLRLSRVCLKRTTVSEDSLLALAALAPKLRWLVGSGPKVSEDTAGKIRVQLPDCKVLRFHRFTMGEVRCCGHLESDNY